MAIKAERCVFVDGWLCPVNGSDVPLEVCRLCIEARKIQAEFTMVKRSGRESEEAIVASEFFLKPSPLIQDALRKQLTELDKQFENDQISLKEYIQIRKSIIEASKG